MVEVAIGWGRDGGRERTVVEVPALSRVRLSRSCADLHERISNDESYDLASFAREATGHFITMDADHTEASYAALLETARALDVSARVITWTMDVQGLVAEWWEHTEATDGLSGVATDAASQAILLKTARTVSARLMDAAAEPRRGLVQLRKVTSLSWTPGSYDFFISYKHMLHRQRAHDLARALRARGHQCFLDEDDLPPDVARVGLFDALRAALDASRCCVFFETVAQATVDEAVSGRRTASSIHVFELRHASNVLVVRLDPPEVYKPRGAWRRSWSGTDGLAEVLTAELGFQDGGSDPGSPELGGALDAARQRVAETLGSDIDVAPLAALALAAPGQVDPTTFNVSSAYGDSVLGALLRYDLETSLTLEEAGLPPEAWAAATAAWPNGRWQTPMRHLTVGWPEVAVQRLRERAARIGIFDEAALAMAVLQEASSPTSAPGRALRRALQALPQPAELDPLQLEAQVSEIIARTLRLLGRRAGVPRHAWVSLTSPGSTEIELPVSRCGPFQLSLPGGDGDVTVELLARQDETLYPAALVQAHQASVRAAAEGDVEEQQWLSGLFPELALTLEPSASRVCVVDVSAAGNGSLLLAATSSSPDADVWSGEGLRSVLPARLARQTRPALLRGRPESVPDTALDDRLALWDLLARASAHLALRARDPAELPTGRGSVTPTSTATGLGSLWPPDVPASSVAAGEGTATETSS